VNDKLLSKKMALSLLSKCGCSQRVIDHCKAVSNLAIKLAILCKKKGINVDLELVEIGSLLHDIGRSKTHGLTHAVVGVEIAKSLNLDDSIVSIIERHIGGGIDHVEAKNLGLPIKDYFPITLEEKIVAYADKLVAGCTVVPLERTIKQFSRKLGENHPAIERIEKLHQELLPLIGDFNAYNNNS
jgi:uncharacterized protein